MAVSESASADLLLDDSSIRLSRSNLGDLIPFDKGGEGTLYRLGLVGPESRPLLYKEYRTEHLDKLDESTLERLPRFIRVLRPAMQRHLYERMAWPTWLVEDNDPATAGPALVQGVVVPMAPQQFFTALPRSSGGRRLVPAKFELLLNGPTFLHRLGLAISRRQQLQLLSSVAETMAFLHSHSVTVGDFSCKNLLFSLSPEPAAYFIDCDSLCWRGVSALPNGETPEWNVPVGHTPGSLSADVYKFGLLALRMHTGAQHSRNPASLPGDVDSSVRELLVRTLGGRPDQRECLITDWTAPLRAAAAQAPADPVEQPNPRRPILRTPQVLPAAQRGLSASPASRGHADAGGAGPAPLLPANAVTDFILALLRRALVRRSATPSLTRLAVALAALWAACGATFGLALAGGLNPHHMSPVAGILLFGSFLVFGVVAFALGTTEPR